MENTVSTQLNSAQLGRAPHNDKRALNSSPISTPKELKRQLPIDFQLRQQIEQQRNDIRACIAGEDSRLLVITGPCSLHDPQAALDYGQRLQQLQQAYQDKLLLVMRAYVEKPRTQVGWKGMAYDPDLQGKGDMAKGIARSRLLLLQLARLGLPLATEALNPLVMQYLDDLISWTAIGARTTESQTHREMVSHLSMPVGIKNSTDGSASNAINAMVAARHSHHTLGMDGNGQIAMLDTPGNADTHLVLRGGHGLTNYDEQSVAQAVEQLQRSDCRTRVLVDCSHANANKQHRRQHAIAVDVAHQHRRNPGTILGIMLESFLLEGRQDNIEPLAYGQSITDPCISWEQTEALLQAVYQVLAP
ncbi:3-deoxy-7-phosphoheptulonate synthase [Bacterioplanes sanyensis]|uniref:Phospho-2-dehydro-3-deoxyheptonate aldolase n=1 Tax=Bacterioplanes sanyensis TaxID=1249553 RepID=A0A222FRD6_9GAMM|nr:3-deoxy-7-phosphoheptulonate synthase [Bacterioplanes sanyensis]